MLFVLYYITMYAYYVFYGAALQCGKSDLFAGHT